MTHIRSRLLLATAVASLSFASLAQAQAGGAPVRPRDGQAPGGMMRRGGGPGGGPDGAPGRMGAARGPRGNPAAMLLRMRSELELTDDQVKKLEALQDAPAPRANEADMLRARADLLEATQGDGNLSKARAALDRLSALRNERMLAGLKVRQDARAVLTAQQKTRLDNQRGQFRGRGAMRGERGQRGQRGMPGMMGGRGTGANAPMPPAFNRGFRRQGAPVPPDAP
ncbi:Spy/CpxP family protein refolding chaperone [Gemmatimonas sp.]